MQLATRVDDEQGRLFKETAKMLGTTPSDALRMFVASFNAHRGFPYDVRLSPAAQVEPFSSEEEATEFTTEAMKAMLNETW